MARDSAANMLGAVVAVIGGAVSLLLLTIVGRSTPPFLLILFIGWVGLPFAALAIANFCSAKWSSYTKTALFAVSILIVFASLFIYGWVTLWPPSSTPARTWLLVPAGSWLLIIAVPVRAYLFRARKAGIGNKPRT